MEDSDIKIFGQKQAQSCDDELRLIALMEEPVSYTHLTLPTKA